ncbi:MAG: bacillithiol system redox-active protein YtxJ [Chitinophagaceae bacterium]
MQWIPLIAEDQLKDILERSATTPQVIYKHSTRCSISSMVRHRLDKKPAPGGIDFYYLDIFAYRPLSNKIAQDLGVQHESPQVLLIKNGQCVYTESHMAIRMDEIEAQSMIA